MSRTENRQSVPPLAISNYGTSADYTGLKEAAQPPRRKT
jgi:hypothetical protein